MTPKFKVGDRVYSLEYQDPGVVTRVINKDEGFAPVYEVELDDEMPIIVAGDQLVGIDLGEPEDVACGFCADLDGGVCVDCAGYKHMVAEGFDIDPDGPEDDAVNHPSHYNRGKIEVIDFITDQGFNYARGNAVKYISRAGHKSPDTEIEDLEKARFYIDYEIKRLKAQLGPEES